MKNQKSKVSGGLPLFVGAAYLASKALLQEGRSPKAEGRRL
ncbi:MAG: hypothetical protein RIE73_07115 [Coleofasciculus sp. C1-SOL-03]